TRGRPDLAWANLLGRMGQSVLIGFWASGTFASLAYFDEYWCILFIFDAARRVVAKEVSVPVNALRPMPVTHVTARARVAGAPPVRARWAIQACLRRAGGGGPRMGQIRGRILRSKPQWLCDRV